jgi:hypothetical protein
MCRQWGIRLKRERNEISINPELHLNSDKLILAAMSLRQVRVAGFGFATALAHVSTVRILAAMYLRRARVVGRSFATALTHVSTVVTTPAPVTQNLGVGLRPPCRANVL